MPAETPAARVPASLDAAAADPDPRGAPADPSLERPEHQDSAPPCNQAVIKPHRASPLPPFPSPTHRRGSPGAHIPSEWRANPIWIMAQGMQHPGVLVSRRWEKKLDSS